jgi:hypothetical protein
MANDAPHSAKAGAEARAWIVSLSAVVSMLSVAVGIWLSLEDYRLKLREEARAIYSGQVETDIKLLNSFTDVMRVGHGRGGYLASRTQNELLRVPVGEAEQKAAIRAIGLLGARHDFLCPAALEALQVLRDLEAETAGKALDELSTCES